jgi:hypothetical protein
LYRKIDLPVFFFTGFFEAATFFAANVVFLPAALPELVEIFFVAAAVFFIAATGFLVFFALLFFDVVAAFTIRNSHLPQPFINHFFLEEPAIGENGDYRLL